MEKKIFAAKLNSFKFASYIIGGFGVIYALSAAYDGVIDNKASIFAGFLTLLIGLFFFWYSKKERKIIVDDKGVEYYHSKLEYKVDWTNLMLLKSFQEEGKETENLILIDNDENVLSISTAFFDSYKLKDAFLYIAQKVKTLEHCSIEDDREWL